MNGKRLELILISVCDTSVSFSAGGEREGRKKGECRRRKQGKRCPNERLPTEFRAYNDEFTP
jgi:hypothetical protein